MAEALIEQWRLAVLRVRLDLSERAPAVAVELVGYPQGFPERVWHDRYAPEEFGLSGGAGAPGATRVPDGLRDAVTRCLSEDFGQEAALWLRLVRPYGFLGAVPWEEVLVAMSGRPVVRVPDLLPGAADPGQVWSVAVALSAAPGSSWAAPYVTSFLTALRGAVPVPVEVDVFADAATFETMTRLSPGWPEDPLIHLHNPGHAGTAHVNRVSRAVHQFRRPRRASAGRATAGLHGDLPADLPADLHGGLVWADWIATGLAGRAVRALHVVGGAAFDTDRALLAISPDPGRPADPAHCTYVTGDEVRLLADTIGASVLSFGSPPDNPSEAATRVIADGVGLQRPGPTFFSTLRLDPGGYALAQAHAFVAGQGVPSGASEASEKEAAPAPIPRDPSLFAYLQPEYVQASLREPWPDPDQPGQGWLTGRSPARDRSVSAVLGPTLESAPSEEVSQYYATAESVPGWVAASERYIDTNVAHLVETAAPPGDAPDARQAYDQGTAKALGELRDLVERHVMGS